MRGGNAWWSRLLDLLERGLGPGGDACLWCGAARRGRPAFPPDASPSALRAMERLCGACASGIPWIARPLCPACGRAEACGDCARRAVSHIVANRAAVRYTPMMKEMLARYKYRGSERLAPLFGDMACAAYERLSSDAWRSETPPRARAALTFVPLSERRLEERGFNQAEAMAAYVGRRFRAPVLPLLSRTRHTEKQSYKTRRERLESLDRAFALRDDGAAELERLLRSGPVRLVIVDDVYTTGSTMQRCGATVAERFGSNGLSIYGLTWAR
ncbi:ComF family protein [Paenibacillus sp.]|uniref:ComF family protein n=1 Tax=Paenibacillus sp. TaxID=58172 RepID=UPI002D45BCA1|nr:ComF family protein [Paenibacillus sp.]HZG87383.1 ComF family protein [Paenibacillus sp.]